MSQLAQKQSALLNALFARSAEDAIKIIAAYAHDPGARGLKAYQSHGRALAGRVLGAAYTVLARMLGEDSFSDLARALWHSCPPVAGDLARWGQALPDFVAKSSQLQDTPYLADVARVEWALHCCATAPDAAADPASLVLLTERDPGDLRFVLAPGLGVACSQWPVASILSAHLDGIPSFTDVGQMLQEGLAQDVVVWREGMRPRVRLALAGEASFLQALLRGLTLGEALDACPDVDFAKWFPAAIQSGLVLGVTEAANA